MGKPIKDCPLDRTIQVIAGKWKAVIIQLLLQRPDWRFSELQAQLPGCSRRMLALQLKELQNDGIVSKRVYATVPPQTKYSLTDRGKQLRSVISGMQKWGQ